MLRANCSTKDWRYTAKKAAFRRTSPSISLFLTEGTVRVLFLIFGQGKVNRKVALNLAG